MTTSRTSRESVEELQAGSPGARTSRESVETLQWQTPKARSSRELVEILWSPLQHLYPAGVPSSEAFGAVGLNLIVSPNSITSTDALGDVAVLFAPGLVGIASGEAFGTPRSLLRIIVTGIASGEAFGNARPTRTLAPLGIASGEAFGGDGLEFLYDEFVGPLYLNGDTGSIETTNVGATMELDEPPSFAGTGTSTIWFRITPEYDGHLVADTHGSTKRDTSDLDTVLEVFTGTGFANLVLIGANDDEPGGGKWSALTVPVRAGVTYYIRVNSWDEGELPTLVTSGFGAGGFGERDFGA